MTGGKTADFLLAIYSSQTNFTSGPEGTAATPPVGAGEAVPSGVTAVSRLLIHGYIET
jgi:hypothetical protein